MKTLLRLLALLCVLLALAWYFGLLPAARLPEAVRAHLPQSTQAPVKLYRWLDAQGRPVYGNQPPAGVKAEIVQAQDRMSVVPATPIPEPVKETRELPPGVTIQQLATERAIEQATGEK